MVKAIPYLFRAVRSPAPGSSPCRGAGRYLHRAVHPQAADFDTAGSVMFLLSLGELEEWTHKKSVDDLARSMSLNIDRVAQNRGR
ncbi:MAG: hypothetical protein ACLR23_20420 [Clostridia bacterium]